MIRLICAAVFSILVLNVSPVCGQSTPSPYPGPRNPPTSGPWNTEEQRLNSQIKDAYNSILYGPDGRSNFSRSEEFFFYNDSITRLEKMLRPTRAERAPYAQFLKQPNTGLVKLVSQPAKVVTVDKLKAEKATASIFPGGSAFYSFTTLNHLPGLWADLKLKDGNFEVSFAPNVLGAITVLGDVPIDSVTTGGHGVNVLETYRPPVDVKQMRIERDRFKARVTLEGYEFQTQVPAIENKTYALRSISYGRSDLLVVLRVVKRNEDGSVLLLWKRLEKFSTPKLKATRK